MVTPLLFLFRIKAIFRDHQFIVWFFYLLWIAVATSAVAAGFALDKTPSADSRYCICMHMSQYGASAMVVTAANDTLVFVFITMKILLDSQLPWTPLWKMFMTGEGLGAVSRAMLQTGQLYYMYVYYLHFSAQSERTYANDLYLL